MPNFAAPDFSASNAFHALKVQTSVILALDTATPFLTMALQWPHVETRANGTEAQPTQPTQPTQPRELATLESSILMERAHAERLPAEVQALFAEAGIPFRADGLVLGIGPGSYTGVRVGVSYALGLADIWGAQILCVPTLEALIHPAQDGEQCATLTAHKGQVYAARYKVQGGCVHEVLTPPAKYTPEAFERFLGGSSGVEAVTEGTTSQTSETTQISQISQTTKTPKISRIPSGRALLQAGLRHGQADINLLYL